MSVTINEIAALANVSRATVDKVIHNRPGIKKETRERVQAILDNVNYQPNLIGKALVMSKNPVKVGIVLTPEYNSFIQVLLGGIKKGQKEFAPFGFEVIVKMLVSLESAELISILNELENMNIAGLALLPINSPQVIQKIHQMQEKGIKILTFNSMLEDIKGFRYIGQDHVKAGFVAGGLMEKLLPDGGKIGVIISSKTLSCHPDRLNGFRKRLLECRNPIEIVEISENQDKKEDAFVIALGYLNKYPDLDGIYMSGNGSDGVKNAMTVASVTHPLKIISHDLVPETEALLKEGIIDFVISQNAREQGYQIVRQLFDYLVKNQIPGTYIYEIPIQVITREMI